ncbi:P-loop containing nucleoside triphosphate hydrolases superfamily protein isoform X2 [Tasmannia lanceolata]|uniref:P-loop containing nucleoside triphosphate hydrolases superfamily protein isoform X2 n=1 Tax=Tasmannia lanceolata TaxID=3420 RepID=UPI0040633359
MSDVLGSRNKLKKRLKFVSTGAKATKIDFESSNTRKGNEKEKIMKDKMGTPNPHFGRYKSESSPKRNSNLGAKDKEFNGKKWVGSENSDKKRKREEIPNRDFTSNSNSINGKSSTEGKSHDVELFKRKPSSQKGRRTERGDSIRGENSKRSTGTSSLRVYNGGKSKSTIPDGEFYEGELSHKRPSSMRGGKSKKDDFIIDKSNSTIDKSSTKGKSHDVEVFKRNPYSPKGRRSERGESIRGENSQRSTSTNSLRLYNGGKSKTTVHDGEFSEGEVSHKRPSSMRGGKYQKDESIERKGVERVLRSSRIYNGGNGKMRGSERSHRVEDRGRVTRVSVGTARSKAINGEVSTGSRRMVADEGEYSLSKHGDKRHNRHQAGIIDKSRKKISSSKKGSDDDSVITDDVPRKRRRVIRMDRHDISRKRLDDGTSMDEKIVEKNTEVSKNAQFRAIQPSPAILSFVEDNLLGRRRLIELQKSGYNIKLPVPLDNSPNSTSLERERIEENVFRNKLTFFAAAKVSTSFPPPDLPEIAFAGRSNVGKSSLLNALTRQWGVVRTSDKPGLTQVKEYVSTRAGLKRVCLLIDTKWGMKPRDHELIDLMERSQTKYQIVLTKTDVVFPIDVARRAMQIQEDLKAQKSVVNPVMMVSSKTGAGIRCLRTVLAKIGRFAK